MMVGRVNAPSAGALVLLVLLVTWAGVGSLAGCEASNSAQRLLEDKMRGYDPLIRPVENNSEVVNVLISPTLSQLIDIDEQNQVMITSLWLKQRWKDHKLTWNPADYDGIEQMQIPIKRLWSPDIVLYNTANGNFAADFINWATVNWDGTVYWNPPVIFRSSCLIDISYFPFDEQRCKMKFGTWTHDGSVVDLNPLTQRFEREYYRPNGEWDIVESPVVKHAIKYRCCQEIFVDVTYTLVLHRNPLFYIITLVIPCILIALLTVLVFCLPSASQEKVTLSISVLIALIVFLLLLPSIVPPTSTTVPLIARYMLFTMAIVSLSIFATVWTINLHFRNSNSHVMGSWTKKIFLYVLPRLMLMERPGVNNDSKEVTRTKQIERALIRSNVPSSFVFPPVDAAACEPGRKEPRGYSRMVVSSSTLSPSLQEEIEYQERISTLQRYEDNPAKRAWDELLGGLQYIQENLKNTDEVEDSEEDWKYVSLVVDRLLLWIFLLVVAVGTTVFFARAPILWEAPDTHKKEVYEDPEILLTAGYYDLYPTEHPIQPAN